MTDITFTFQSKTVRTVGTSERPLFNVGDVCGVLKLADPSDVIERLDQDEVEILAKNGSQRVLYAGPDSNVYITESGLYSLILTSRKPEARAFKKWVTSEVLPSIRRTGQYQQRQLTTGEQLLASAQMLVDLERRQAEHDRRLSEIEADRLREQREAAAVGALPLAQAAASGVTDGQRTVSVVVAYAKSHGGAYPDTWRALYSRVESAPETRIDLRTRLANAKSKRDRGEPYPQVCDVIDATGKAAEIYAIARMLFG